LKKAEGRPDFNGYLVCNYCTGNTAEPKAAFIKEAGTVIPQHEIFAG
jgi:hypothetical protein